ncbi:ABC-type transport system periplasmic substrate-binding protein (probable substrate tungstate) (plasmid) [Natrialba magadii ATCC 43099]|uniref:ABC-type transport system periplasmic substrate-binding protein (Probable substrate tungstate) n=1 Tax=Natrialba magadii (strain ATCC 43099 / DSM 3394 / CCM 3739 / CIP 104546 / IAM 13178 / JCM 8861 / NBRC 102185 / NCIMB 2190 / MS3) TaxID=547559 RepID=D3T1P2_NATMM|nr:substrate-binding domain-containing protein [Natrialba magadii]ADD07501.1 ABC-type transport system periplasmic substrate-binding protein (probable substrate tungstate) [Natrialba magadii ATCC 43099]ELY26533.1 molybdate transport protein [Natrialba magadii ATCC 43099]
MAIQRRGFIAAVGTGGAVGLAGCTGLGDDTGDSDNTGPEISGETLTLTTTTSTYDTGLLDELNAPFEDRYGVTVVTVAQGTGAALETARNGDSDVVMVHARSLEDEFMEDGFGVNRRDLMFNDFVIVGNSDDPAGVGGEEDIEAALTAIADAESEFVSRGDNSGTHTKELELWDAAGLTIEEFGEWYIDGGGGMGEILNQASMQEAYTLADRGTYLDMQDEIDLEIHVEGPVKDGPDELMNTYGIVAVNPAVHEHVNYDLAMAYIGYITSVEGQDIIESYTSAGEQLFFAEALSEDPEFQQYVPEGWGSSTDDE